MNSLKFKAGDVLSYGGVAIYLLLDDHDDTRDVPVRCLVLDAGVMSDVLTSGHVYDLYQTDFAVMDHVFE